VLGTFVKSPEVQYHHEVYNQFLGIFQVVVQPMPDEFQEYFLL